MLSALLLAGLFAAPIATAGLFLGNAGTGRSEGVWRHLGRLALSLISTGLLIAVVAALLAAIRVTERNILAAAIGLFVVSLIWLPFTRKWGARAHMCWSATTYLFIAYLSFMMWWTFASHLGVAGTMCGVILWSLELAAAFLGCAYLWELCDTLGRASWTRRVDEHELKLVDGDYLPFVSLQVPCYNEPPEMVIATLESLQQLDFPHFETIVIDDNTDDESLWRPVEAWCREHSVKFVHLSDWPGYKSGALNYALEHMTDDRSELVGVIDSDYRIEPTFLRKCAPLFADPKVGFIQTPQDYREWETAPFYRRLYYSYKYFFAVSQPSRNERDGAIFAGTMGLIRRRALEQVGGWDEWCITEDAELSLRLLRSGWSGRHVDRSFGKGIMPLTFEALKVQRFRWCFGGIQILRRNWRSMMPVRDGAQNHLSLGQRWSYFSGAIQWYGDLLGLVFFAFLLVGAANIAFSGGLLFRKLTGFLIAAIPVLVVLGLVRAVALLRRGTGASWREALGAFVIWQSTSLTVARASVQALYAKEASFLRTPKTADEAHIGDALRANWVEGLLGVIGVAAIAGALTRHTGYGGFLIAGLLLWPTASFLAAPYNSVSAQRASLPPDLTERRRTEYLRSGARHVSFAIGGLGLAGTTAAFAFAVLTAGPSNVVPPQLVGPSQGHPAKYGSGDTSSTSTTSTTTPAPVPASSTSTTAPTTTSSTTSTPSTTTSSTTTTGSTSTTTTTAVGG